MGCSWDGPPLGSVSSGKGAVSKAALGTGTGAYQAVVGTSHLNDRGLRFVSPVPAAVPSSGQQPPGGAQQPRSSGNNEACPNGNPPATASGGAIVVVRPR